MIVDASFLVALFLPEDVHHEKAVKVLKQHKDHVLIIVDRIIEETMAVLIYKKSIHYAFQVLQRLQANKMVHMYDIDARLQKDIFELMQRVGKRLSFTDYVVVFLARYYGVYALCFDKEILKLAKK